MNNNSNAEPDFQLSSGGLMQVIRHWVRGPDAGEVPMRIQLLVALGVMWLPISVLTLIAGTFFGEMSAQPFITDVVPQVRFLVAVPLLLFADITINPAVAGAIRNLQAHGFVPDGERNRFQVAKAKLIQYRDSVWPDVIILVLAYSFTWFYRPGYGDVDIETTTASWLWSVSDGHGSLTSAGWWYVAISAPLFQFVLLRWVWRLLIWAAFLRRISHIPLVLHATHPDLAGGLGMLGDAQQTFSLIFVAVSAIVSSTVAHTMLVEGTGVEGVRLELFVFVSICVVLIYAPLLFFTRTMYTARRLGLIQYGALAYQLSDAFFAKWVKRRGPAVGTELKDSTDSSSMADYGANFDTVRSMRAIPVSLRSIGTVAAVLLAPFLPLYLIEFSITDLLQRVMAALI